MSGPVAIADNVQRTLSIASRTRSLDSVSLHNNDNNSLTNGETARSSTETVAFRHRELKLQNGEFYSGSLLGNVPEGSGKYVWSNGCKYEGDWRRGICHGYGKLHWPSGAGYEGEFSGGYMQGTGIYIRDDKLVYNGRWRLSRKHRLGYQTFPNGDVFEGSWIQGSPDGPGKYIRANGNEYLMSYNQSVTADELGIVAEEESLEDEISPQGLVLVPNGSENGSVIVGPHIRGSRLRSSATDDAEMDLLLPSIARLQIQIGVNMPARAEFFQVKKTNKCFTRYTMSYYTWVSSTYYKRTT